MDTEKGAGYGVVIFFSTGKMQRVGLRLPVVAALAKRFTNQGFNSVCVSCIIKGNVKYFSA